MSVDAVEKLVVERLSPEIAVQLVLASVVSAKIILSADCINELQADDHFQKARLPQPSQTESIMPMIRNCVSSY